MKIELSNCTSTLLHEIAIKECKRNTIANTYALAIMSSEVTDWGKVNKAIIDRWSKSGLEHIKKRAWKLIEKEAVTYD